MITLIKLIKRTAPAPDDAYQAHLGHLYTCEPCAARPSEPCPTGKRLRGAVTAARSAARGAR